MTLFGPIDWSYVFYCALWGAAVGMIVAAYWFVMLTWVLHGKPGLQDLPTELPSGEEPSVNGP